MEETCFWWERLPERSGTVQGRTGRYRWGGRGAKKLQTGHIPPQSYGLGKQSPIKEAAQIGHLS